MALGRHDKGADAAVMAEINITPFTDVLLVLLIIFMILAALTIPPGFERQFSNCACGTPPAASVKQIAIVVTHTNRIYVDGKPTSVTALYALLAQLHARSPREKAAIYADVKAPYGTIIRVLDAAKAGGIADVSFVTQ
jgi:biopolymer transport protein ExbD